MKNFKLTIALLGVLAILLSGCGSSSNVVGSGLLQKRKHNKGFHFVKSSIHKSKGDVNKIKPVVVKSDDSALEMQSKAVVINRNAEHESYTGVVDKAETYYEQESVKAEVSKETNIKSVVTYENKVNDQDVVLNNMQLELISTDNQSSAKAKTLKETNSGGRSSSSIPFVLLIIITFFIPFLGVGLYTDWDLTKTVIAVLLWLLLVVPAIVYGMLVIFDVI